MSAYEVKKNRRLNIMISQPLAEWAASAAESRGISMSSLVRESLEAERKRELEKQLTEAADSLSALYEEDADLTALTALDGDDFS